MFNKKSKPNSIENRGTIIILIMSFTSIFLVVCLTIANLTVNQYKMTNYKENWNMAFHIAEAGIDYYKWHLAHDPSDLENTSSCILRDKETTLFSRLGTETEITFPEIGPGGNMVNNNGTMSFVDGGLDGNALQEIAGSDSDYVTFPTSGTMTVDNGSIVLWYKPYYNHTESTETAIFEADGYGEFELSHDEHGALYFKMQGGGGDNNANVVAYASPENYFWNANDWVKLEARWETSFPGPYNPLNKKNIQLYVNDILVACATADTNSYCYNNKAWMLGNNLTLNSNITLAGRGDLNGMLDTIVISRLVDAGEGETQESLGTYFGPYTFDYTDTSGQVVGQYTLEIERPDRCSNAVAIRSTGNTLNRPETKRVIEVKFGKKTLAEYALASNAALYIESGKSVLGPIHSNIGVRQDGVNNSRVTASQNTYTCGIVHDCSLFGETRDGVWGSGEDSNLWTYPVSNMDFNLLTTNLSSLKLNSQKSNLYFPKSDYDLGYHITFLNDGTFNIYRVTKLKSSVSYIHNWDYGNKKFDIQNETLLGNYEIPSNCAIIFIEDDVWVDGVVNGRATIVAALLPDMPSQRKNIYIDDNITYTSQDGSDVLGLIAQDSVILTYETPEDIEINAAMIAQHGSVYRPNFWNFFNFFFRDGNTHVSKDTITVYGSIISNQEWYWHNAFEGFEYSGYINEVNIYDPQLTYYPPPGFPTNDEYSILQWEEVTENYL